MWGLNFSKRHMMRVCIAILAFLTVVVLGALIIGTIEGWDFTDSFYMSMMTATTIGFGDITPITEAGKIFISLYSLVTVGMFLYLFCPVGKLEIYSENLMSWKES